MVNPGALPEAQNLVHSVSLLCNSNHAVANSYTYAADAATAESAYLCFHFHGLQNKQQLSFLHRLALLNQHFENVAGKWCTLGIARTGCYWSAGGCTLRGLDRLDPFNI